MTHRRSKITPALDSVESIGQSDDLVDVVVELDGSVHGQNDVAARKSAFAELAKPVSDAITDLGGEVLGEAWINQTLRARVPGSRVRDLSTLDEVMLVDVPREIKPD